MAMDIPAELRDEGEALCVALPYDGSFVTDKWLREELGYDSDEGESRYWKLRNTLVAAGRVHRGRGAAGASGALVVEEPVPDPAEAEEAVKQQAARDANCTPR